MDVSMKPGMRQHGPATLRLSFNTNVPAHLRGGLLEVSHVLTPERHRGHGYASMLLQKVCAEADEAAKVLLVFPKPYADSPLSDEQLMDWYSAFGFDLIQTQPAPLMARAPNAEIRVKKKPLAFAMGVH
jgi:GNAT superfamily N-acetyltransferase